MDTTRVSQSNETLPSLPLPHARLSFVVLRLCRHAPRHLLYLFLPLVDLVAEDELQGLSGLDRSPLVADVVDVYGGELEVLDQLVRLGREELGRVTPEALLLGRDGRWTLDEDREQSQVRVQSGPKEGMQSLSPVCRALRWQGRMFRMDHTRRAHHACSCQLVWNWLGSFRLSLDGEAGHGAKKRTQDFLASPSKVSGVLKSCLTPISSRLGRASLIWMGGVVWRNDDIQPSLTLPMTIRPL